MPNVYSYIRFSSIKQKAGTSIDRQLEYAQRWAAENGMALDESLSLRDEGLSAYHQKHVKRGALGAFLEAITAGQVPAGSVLIVESLDRLSRAEPILAQAQLAQIINAEITVVTALDNKRYNREILKTNPMDLVYSLLIMIRAHEESETKSHRARAALVKRCEKWEPGMLGATFGRMPRWIRRAGDGFELIEERAMAIRLAIDLFRKGHGHARISDELTAQGLTLTGNDFNSNQLYRIIRNPALSGQKVVETEGRCFVLDRYYPAIVTADEFAELQMLMDQRARTGGDGKGKIVGILTGLGIVRCGYCGSPMAANNILKRARIDGTLADGNRRIICSSAASKVTCPHPNSASVAVIEQSLMRYCSDQMNLSALLSGSDRQAPARARLAAARAVVADIENKLARITEALMATDDVAPLVFVRKARDLESELASARNQQQKAEQEVSALNTQDCPALSEAWAKLVDGVIDMDPEARQTARQLVRNTFERIVIYTQGFMPANDTKRIGLLLTARGGTTRMLVIDRKTGNWTRNESLKAPA